MSGVATKNVVVGGAHGRALQEEIEQFLFREARLLDESDYSSWLTLIAPEIHYWMPVIGSPG